MVKKGDSLATKKKKTTSARPKIRMAKKAVKRKFPKTNLNASRKRLKTKAKAKVKIKITAKQRKEDERLEKERIDKEIKRI